MSGILALIVKAFADAFGAALVDLVATWRRESAAKTAQRQLGAAEARNALDEEVKEAADAQAELNAADRGGAAAVLERLRQRPAP